MDHRRITRHTARHHGVLLPTFLDDEGVTPKQRRGRVASGEWRRLPNGILVLAGIPETFEMRATAALAAVPNAALSHQSAGHVLGAEVHDRRIHLAVPSGGITRSPGAVLHRTTLDPCDVTQRHGFRVTTLERTLVDLGATVNRAELKSCIQDRLIHGATTFTRVDDTFVRLARPGRTGIARTRAVLAAIDGDPPTESELEAMFLGIIHRHRLPEPEWLVTMEWAETEVGRVDCWYPDARVIVELDGRRFHARLAAFERDRRRDQVALMEGIPTLRFTHHQITDDPRWVAGVVRAVIGARNPCQK